ncbi:MAG: hypothetical protein SWX82_05525 [Cyanobacteriota bacterium]|nr:hypothetical protein [Cyanobacteriota bacterium]
MANYKNIGEAIPIFTSTSIEPIWKLFKNIGEVWGVWGVWEVWEVWEV